MKNKNMINKGISILQLILLSISSLLILLPFLAVVFTSFRTKNAYELNPIGFPESLNFDNYLKVIKVSKVFDGYYNSIVIIIVVTFCVILFGSLAAYALTKMQFTKAKTFTLVFLAPMIFPIYSAIVPLYLIFNSLKLVNRTGVIIIDIALFLPLVIFILTSFMNTIPYQISESALVEGAGHFRIYSTIIVPLIRPAFASSIILSALPAWNDFFLPLIMLNNLKQRTLPIIINDFSGITNRDLTLMTACVVLIVLPVIIVYIALQKQFISGVTEGSLKG